MDDFKERMKVPGDYLEKEGLIDVNVSEEKKEIYYKVLRDYATMGLMGIGLNLASKERLGLTEKIIEEIKRNHTKLSSEEVIALATISRELIHYCSRQENYIKNPTKENIMRLLYFNHDIQKENAVKIVAATLKDMEYAKKHNTIGEKYEFKFDHIDTILRGGIPAVYCREIEQEENSIGEK